MRYRTPALAVLAVLLAGCGSSSDTDTGEDTSQDDAAAAAQDERYLKQVRRNIPGAVAYNDELLLGFADTICANSKPETALRVVDNYSGIEPEDREEYVLLTFATRCDQDS